MVDYEPIRRFVLEMTKHIEHGGEELSALAGAKELLGRLIACDAWLPDEFAQPHPEHYQQYLLYCDPFERFSLVSFVWGPGQRTPIHDHTVWGVIGMLRGAEVSESFELSGRGEAPRATGSVRLEPGQIEAVSP